MITHPSNLPPAQRSPSVRRIAARLCSLTGCLCIGACSGGYDQPPPQVATPAGTAPEEFFAPAPPRVYPEDAVDTFAFVDSGEYAASLVGCTYAQGFHTILCSHEDLPYIGQLTDVPTLDDVLERLVVSHQWMGENFRDVMMSMPADTLQLFRVVKAVVIASDIRPAEHRLGIIYLDPEFLWLTAEQRDTILEQEDFRGDYGADLTFRILNRYVRDGEPLGVRGDAEQSRELQDLPPILGVVLYHELAHAVDQMQPARLPGLGPDDYPYWGPYLYDEWADAYPISSSAGTESSVLEALASIRFSGRPALDSHRALQPADVIESFTAEGAVTLYSYSNEAEDFALAFEAAMMSYHFGYDTEVAVTDNVAESDDDAIVLWGQTGRLGEQRVYQRVLGAVQALYPGDLSAVEAHLSGLPLPSPLTPGCRWSEYLGTDAPACL